MGFSDYRADQRLASLHLAEHQTRKQTICVSLSTTSHAALSFFKSEKFNLATTTHFRTNQTWRLNAAREINFKGTHSVSKHDVSITKKTFVPSSSASNHALTTAELFKSAPDNTDNKLYRPTPVIMQSSDEDHNSGLPKECPPTNRSSDSYSSTITTRTVTKITNFSWAHNVVPPVAQIKVPADPTMRGTRGS